MCVLDLQILQEGFKSVDSEDTPPPPDIIQELKSLALQFINAAKYYALNPNSIEESEWGFFLAGSVIGSIISGLFMSIIFLIFGPAKAKGASFSNPSSSKKIN